MLPDAAALVESDSPALDFIQPLALVELKKQLGTPDPSRVEFLFANTSRADFDALGKSISTEDILADAPGFFGTVLHIYDRMTPETRESLIGFSPAYVTIGVDEAVKLQKLNEAFDAVAKHGARNQARQATRLKELTDRGVLLRNQGLAAIRPLVEAEKLDKAQYEALKSPKDDPKQVADNLLEIGALIRDVYSAQDPDGKAAMIDGKLTESYCRKLEHAGNEIRAALEQGTARTGQTKTAQKELDYQDGRALFVISYIYTLFRRAQELDSTVILPRVNRLARLFRPHKSSKKSKKQEDQNPNEAAAGTTTAANAPAQPAANPPPAAAPAAAPPPAATTPPAATNNAPAGQKPAAAAVQQASTAQNKRGKKAKRLRKGKKNQPAAPVAAAPAQPAAQGASTAPPAQPSTAPPPPVSPAPSQAPPPAAALSLVTAAVPSLTIPLVTGSSGNGT